MKKWFRTTWMYKTLTKFLTWFGDLRIDFDPPKTKAKHIRKLMQVVRPGDILCRGYDCYVDSIFIKGDYTHSGIVMDKRNMLHAIAEGVCEIDVMDFVLDTDGFIVLRPRYKSLDQKEKTLLFAKNQLGKPYDFLFDLDKNGAFYCHKFSARSIEVGGIEVIPEESIIYAEDLIKICEIVYVPDMN